MGKKIIFDTDPGIDDAFALLYALNHPSLEVIGITTVYGNVPVKLATNNALILSELSQSKTPVFSGKEKPLEREIKQFPNFIHGDDGLGNIMHKSSNLKMSDENAVDFIAGSINDCPGEIDIIAVGPLTNIAASAIEYPEIIKKVKSVTIMGGSWMAGGNISPVAEANIYNDPEAADIVFKSSWPVTMVGLDVTHKVFLSTDQLEYLSKIGNKSGKFLKDISNYYVKFYKEKKNMNGCFFHDATAVISMTNPELFEFKMGRVFVSQDELTRGQTVVYLDGINHKNSINDGRGEVKILSEVEGDQAISNFMDIAEKFMK